MTKRYDISDSERVKFIMKWLGGERLYFVETLTEEKKERWKNSATLFSVLNEKSKPQHKLFYY